MKMRSIAVLIIYILLAVVAAFAQSDAEKALQKKEENFSVKKGDPPPGNALSIPVPIARLTVRDLINKRRLVSWKGGYTYLEARNVLVSKDGVSFDYDSVLDQKRGTKSFNLVFKKTDYLTLQAWNDDAGAFFSMRCGSFWSGCAVDTLVFAWNDKRKAEEFQRAFNRLLYEAWHESPAVDELSVFTAHTAAWKANPLSGPPKPADWDKYPILAEQAVKESDYIGAIKKYEEGVAAYPLWAEGWFNAALLYDGLKEYEYAANRMRHYLVLMPDAPDAKAAREKIIVWEAKAKQ